MKNISIRLSTADREINLTPVVEFFARNQQLTPELIAYELESIRDCMVTHAPEACELLDVRASFTLLNQIIGVCREM